MSIHFHKLRVKEIRKETDACVSICFDIPKELEEIFTFQPGQNITIKKEYAGAEIRRSYSICSAPYENELRVAVKKAEGGTFSVFANENLQTGDYLNVLPPTGNFYTTLDSSHRKKYIAFAAGSGITPVISIIKTTLQAEPASTFTLVYGNRNRLSIIFLEELQGLKNKYMTRFNLIHVLSREKAENPVNNGRLDIEKLNELSTLLRYTATDEFFICGPETMIFSVKEFLENKGIDKKKIHFELFTTPGEKKPEVKSQRPEIKAGLKSKIMIKSDGRSFEFELNYNEESILDGALKQGIDLPYSCKGGVCCTCKAKLIEGKIEMDVHWGLEDEEVEQGYILTCQSHPKTEKVKIDFDVK